jgi:hypothetical protein
MTIMTVTILVKVVEPGVEGGESAPPLLVATPFLVEALVLTKAKC